jgi:ABC-type lipoprotein export system ATPase subunit
MVVFSIPESVRVYSLVFQPVEIRSGDFVFVDGISGSGKTTFLKLVAGYHPKYLGTVERSEGFLDGVAFYFHDFHLLEQYGIRENCLFQSLFLDHTTRNAPELSERFEKYADRFGIRSLLGKKISELSSGEYQRVCLIRTLLRGKPVVILDEPVAFLDAQNKKAVLETLLSLSEAGTTILISSHDREDFDFFKSRVPEKQFIPYSISSHE